MDEWSRFRRSFRECKAKARALITERQARDEIPRSTRTEEWKVRQPRLELPKFHGDIRKFQEFWDQLEVSVHEQADLSNATNLAYLRRCLTGAAFECNTRFIGSKPRV
ncbi:conserved hypothetical protein [Trichinella spiralis]|uniref:Uncharacterized protein n=1 Tax=Trichinella spiralis TaxID=6334 RepID=E5SVY1_TRISP|nr:conserved hypothetical protein [Trichinella spiralis]KRY27481.1 hypothetical protein T01_747 [Trichinella spiralis]